MCPVALRAMRADELRTALVKFELLLGLFVGVGVGEYPPFLKFDEEFLDGYLGDLGGSACGDEFSRDGLYGYG